MGASTAIAWTRSLPEPFASLQLALISDAIWLEVPKLMAIVAERHAVADIKGKLRIFGHRLFMVGAEVASAIVAAVSALVAVALEYRRSPGDVFRLPTEAQRPLEAAMREGVMIGAARSGFPSSRGDQGALRFGQLAPAHLRRSALPSLAESLPRFVAMASTAKQRWLTGLEKVLPVRPATARITDLPDAIDAAHVFRELASRSPFFAPTASVETAGDALLILDDTQAGGLCSLFQRAVFRLSHG